MTLRWSMRLVLPTSMRMRTTSQSEGGVVDERSISPERDTKRWIRSKHKKSLKTINLSIVALNVLTVMSIPLTTSIFRHNKFMLSSRILVLRVNNLTQRSLPVWIESETTTQLSEMVRVRRPNELRMVIHDPLSKLRVLRLQFQLISMKRSKSKKRTSIRLQ